MAGRRSVDTVTAMNENQAAVELEAVTKRFKDMVAVDGLSIRVDRGEIFGLLGPNGSGKTTTLNMILGLTAPSTGRIRVLDREMPKEQKAVRRLLGTVPQETALYEELSAEANLRFHADLFDIPYKGLNQRIDQVLNLVQLEDRRRSPAGTFSGGMKRRLALARALLHEPELLFLDEPTLGVDVHSRRALWDHILDLKAKGRTLLLTTNYLEEANTLCDRIAIIDHGKLVVVDTPANLRQRFGDTVIEMGLERKASAELLQKLRALTGVAEVVQPNGVLRVSLEGGHAVAGHVVTLVAGEHGLRSITQREPSLEEVFLSLTGAGLRD
ncbi:MAG: ABC transporter ATP-binding protein [Candidatus Dormibacteraceae bacterium]